MKRFIVVLPRNIGCNKFLEILNRYLPKNVTLLHKAFLFHQTKDYKKFKFMHRNRPKLDFEISQSGRFDGKL